jgi:hypothetical protein
MYAIVKNVASPPRISRPTVDPRALISKYRSNRLAGRVLWSTLMAYLP